LNKVISRKVVTVQKWTVEKTFTPENYLISGRFCPTQENVGSQIRLALLLNTNKRRRNTAEELNGRITTFPDPLLLENSQIQIQDHPRARD
jgi:hypothetical protein